MSRGFRGAWFIAGLAMIAAIVGGGREARAGGVSLKLGVGMGGDPVFTYDAYVTLDPNTIVPQSSPGQASIDVTFTGITGITSNATDTVNVLFQYPGSLVAFWTVTLSTANGGTIHLQESNPFSSFGPFTGSQELLEVEIKTPPNTPEGLKGGDVVFASTTLGGTTTNNIPVRLFSIPEPSSMILMLLGGTVLPFYAIRERARRSRRVA
jgi:hypothetical protein